MPSNPHDNYVIDRIEKLEEADKELATNLQRLALQTERVAVATEVLAEAMAKQYEQNERLAALSERVGSVEHSMDIVKKVGTTILTVGIGMIMYFLFGGS